MSNQVVVPFRAPSGRRPWVAPSSRRAETERSGRKWSYRLATAREMVRALVDTLSYLGDARVRPPALPPKRTS